MKKVVFLLIAMFICMSPAAFAETTSHGPKPKGYNYSQNKRNSGKHYKQQMSKFRNTPGHVCSGHRYKKQH